MTTRYEIPSLDAHKQQIANEQRALYACDLETIGAALRTLTDYSDAMFGWDAEQADQDQRRRVAKIKALLKQALDVAESCAE